MKTLHVKNYELMEFFTVQIFSFINITSIFNQNFLSIIFFFNMKIIQKILLVIHFFKKDTKKF